MTALVVMAYLVLMALFLDYALSKRATRGGRIVALVATVAFATLAVIEAGAP